MRTALIQAWMGFITSISSGAAALTQIDWFSLLQAIGGLVLIVISATAGVYSIRASRCVIAQHKQPSKE